MVNVKLLLFVFGISIASALEPEKGLYKIVGLKQICI